MLVNVCLDARFYQTPDGAIWDQSGCTQAYWRRYLEVFEGVRVVAQMARVPSRPTGFHRSDCAEVTFGAVPHYLGPWQYVLKAAAVRRAVRDAPQANDAIILRAGCQIANCLFPALLRNGRPYAVEVVGDPWDVFAPGVVRHVLRPFLRIYLYRCLRSQCTRQRRRVRHGTISPATVSSSEECVRHLVHVGNADAVGVREGV